MSILFSLTAVFLVAYFVLLVLICIPVCYVQIKLGAVYRRGIVGIFSHLVPILKGKVQNKFIYNLIKLTAVFHFYTYMYIVSYPYKSNYSSE